ncbi:MAG TPA: SDR family oxidoreductase [Trebonia sp.]
MNRTVLVTGGGNGLGKAVAARFLADGDAVIITGRDAGRLSATAAEIGAVPVACDGSDPRQVARLAAEIGPVLDVLVNMAGGNTDFTPATGQATAKAAAAGAARKDTATDDAAAADAGTDDAASADAGTDDGAAAGAAAELGDVAAAWRANLDANLLTAVLTTTAVRGRLRPGGAIINVGSIGAEYASTSYGAAKAALAAWTSGLSAEVGRDGLTANVISPGYIAGTDFFRGRLTDQRQATLIGATHDGRAGHPDDIAETAFFLASAGARHITGQVLHVNGGAHTTR